MICFNCNDKGIVGGCPVCEKELSMVTKVPEFIRQEDRDLALSVIPQDYRVGWDSSILRNQFLDYENDDSFNTYIKKLDSLVAIFQKGQLPTRSALIISSAGMGKTHLAYCCMMLAASNGFKVAPIIDTTQYRRLNNISMDPAIFKYYIKDNPEIPTIDSILTSDVQFMYVDQTCFKDSHRDIMSLVCKRDRLGKPTIILSCNTVNQIAMTDYEQDFKRFIQDNNFSKQKQLRVLSMMTR